MIIYYQVEAKYWRRKPINIHNETTTKAPVKADLVKTVTVFKKLTPLLSRKAAFSHYNSIIDVLYSGLNKEQTTDAQARIDLQSYMDSGNAVELGGSPKTFKSSPDYDNGIEVYLVIEDELLRTKKKYVIHGIRYLDYPDKFDGGIQDSLEGLVKEYDSYKEYDCSLGENVCQYNFENLGFKKVSFINTPFNWESLIEEYNGFDLFEVW